MLVNNFPVPYTPYVTLTPEFRADSEGLTRSDGDAMTVDIGQFQGRATGRVVTSSEHMGRRIALEQVRLGLDLWPVVDLQEVMAVGQHKVKVNISRDTHKYAIMIYVTPSINYLLMYLVNVDCINYKNWC